LVNPINRMLVASCINTAAPPITIKYMVYGDVENDRVYLLLV
jgi:hypothetical protein